MAHSCFFHTDVCAPLAQGEHDTSPPLIVPLAVVPHAQHAAMLRRVPARAPAAFASSSEGSDGKSNDDGNDKDEPPSAEDVAGFDAVCDTLARLYSGYHAYGAVVRSAREATPASALKELQGPAGCRAAAYTTFPEGTCVLPRTRVLLLQDFHVPCDVAAQVFRSSQSTWPIWIQRSAQCTTTSWPASSRRSPALRSVRASVTRNLHRVPFIRAVIRSRAWPAGTGYVQGFVQVASAGANSRKCKWCARTPL